MNIFQCCWLFALALTISCGVRDTSSATELAHVDSLRRAALDSEITALARANASDSSRASAVRPFAPARSLSPAAAGLAMKMVFMVHGQTAFTAASRKGRLLVDLGRIDTAIASPEALQTYRQAVAVHSAVKKGDRFRLRGPWGSEDATVVEFDVWAGRMVAVLETSPAVDALVQKPAPLTAVAVRVDSAMPASPSPCVRDSVGADGVERVTRVRDSITARLRADTADVPHRLAGSVRVRSSRSVGCFAGARVLLIVTRTAGQFERVREIAVLIGEGANGAVTPVRLGDFRFRAHEALHALDADGDGVDDLAARGRAMRVGGTVILKLTVSPKARLDHYASGFSWES
ncbi:MAG: hypothetical protein ABR543_04915 [Gemmatimonadaceae bacterium]